MAIDVDWKEGIPPRKGMYWLTIKNQAGFEVGEWESWDDAEEYRIRRMPCNIVAYARRVPPMPYGADQGQRPPINPILAKRRQRVVDECISSGALVQGDDGYWLFWPDKSHPYIQDDLLCIHMEMAIRNGEVAKQHALFFDQGGH